MNNKRQGLQWDAEFAGLSQARWPEPELSLHARDHLSQPFLGPVSARKSPSCFLCILCPFLPGAVAGVSPHLHSQSLSILAAARSPSPALTALPPQPTCTLTSLCVFLWDFCTHVFFPEHPRPPRRETQPCSLLCHVQFRDWHVLVGGMSSRGLCKICLL